MLLVSIYPFAKGIPVNASKLSLKRRRAAWAPKIYSPPYFQGGVARSDGVVGGREGIFNSNHPVAYGATPP